MKLSFFCFLLSTFCVLVDAERAEAKMRGKTTNVANTLQLQDAEGVGVNILKSQSTEQANVSLARDTEQAEVKVHKSKKISGVQLQATSSHTGDLDARTANCEAMKTFMNGALKTYIQGLKNTENDARKLRQLNRIIIDIDEFLTQAAFSFQQANSKNEYIAMFSKHLRYRIFQLGFHSDQVDICGHPHRGCWGDQQEPQNSRIYWGQHEANSRINGATSEDAQRVLALTPAQENELNNDDTAISVFEAARRINDVQNLDWDDDMFIVTVTRHQAGTNGEWVALNNRGLTLHVLLNKAPLRVLPRFPWNQETNRNGFYAIIQIYATRNNLAPTPQDVNAFGLTIHGQRWTKALPAASVYNPGSIDVW